MPARVNSVCELRTPDVVKRLETVHLLTHECPTAQGCAGALATDHGTLTGVSGADSAQCAGSCAPEWGPGWGQRRQTCYWRRGQAGYRKRQDGPLEMVPGGSPDALGERPPDHSQT